MVFLVSHRLIPVTVQIKPWIAVNYEFSIFIIDCRCRCRYAIRAHQSARNHTVHIRTHLIIQFFPGPHSHRSQFIIPPLNISLYDFLTLIHLKFRIVLRILHHGSKIPCTTHPKNQKHKDKPLQPHLPELLPFQIPVILPTLPRIFSLCTFLSSDCQSFFICFKIR